MEDAEANLDEPEPLLMARSRSGHYGLSPFQVMFLTTIATTRNGRIDGVWSSSNRSEQASHSRSLRRLEERGYVERWGSPGSRRTTEVRLTAAGRELAERLLADQELIDEQI